MTPEGKGIKQTYQWEAKSQWKALPLTSELRLSAPIFRSCAVAAKSGRIARYENKSAYIDSRVVGLGSFVRVVILRRFPNPVGTLRTAWRLNRRSNSDAQFAITRLTP
jgi:hypothetical protein